MSNYVNIKLYSPKLLEVDTNSQFNKYYYTREHTFQVMV